jgi:hypothetical protein
LGSGGIAPRIFNFCAEPSEQLHAPAALLPEEEPTYLLVMGWVGSRATLDVVVVKDIIVPSLVNEPWLSGPATRRLVTVQNEVVIP